MGWRFKHRAQVSKTPEENIVGKPHGIGLDSDFLAMILKAQETKAKIEGGIPSSLKSSVQNEKQPTEWEKMFVIYI